VSAENAEFAASASPFPPALFLNAQNYKPIFEQGSRNTNLYPPRLNAPLRYAAQSDCMAEGVFE